MSIFEQRQLNPLVLIRLASLTTGSSILVRNSVALHGQSDSRSKRFYPLRAEQMLSEHKNE